MADEKKAEVVTLVAVERGFLGGNMVEPGESFPFALTDAAGKSRRLPKWAAKEGDPVLTKPKPKNGDLKPVAAQKAAKEKALGLANDLVG